MQRRNFISLCAQSAIIGATGFNISCSKQEKSSSAAAAAFDDLEKHISGWMKEFKVVGASVALIQHGEMVWNKAFGVRNTTTNEPVNTDTLFEAASVSKTVFTYAVMRLVQSNDIDLDRPLSQYYPDLFSNGDPRLQLITARQVLSHTTGMPDWRSGDKMQFAFDPGNGFGYSGEGFYYLQTVVSRLKGQMFDNPCGNYESGVKVCATDIAQYMKQNVLTPIGMTDSTYEIDYPTATNVATPHNVENKPYSKNSFNAADVARYASAGGLLTNAKEFSKFLINLFHPKDNDPFILNSGTSQEMFRPQSDLPKGQEIDGCQRWALGWGLKDTPQGRLIVHSGGQQGIVSLAMASLEHQNAFIVLTNSDNGGHVSYRLGEELTDWLFA